MYFIYFTIYVRNCYKEKLTQNNYNLATINSVDLNSVLIIWF